MWNKTWRIVLLVIILVAMLWPNLIGTVATFWVSLVAIVLLIIGELFHTGSKGHSEINRRPKTSRSKTKKRKRR